MTFLPLDQGAEFCHIPVHSDGLPTRKRWFKKVMTRYGLTWFLGYLLRYYTQQILLRQYKGTAFKVANLNRWLVIVSGPTLVEELRQAGDDELSSLEATVDVCVNIAGF